MPPIRKKTTLWLRTERLHFPGDTQPITEYMSPAGLDFFLGAPSSKRTKTGLLQNFIRPKGSSNFVIRVSWTPTVCSMDSCINVNKLDDPDLVSNVRKQCLCNPRTNDTRLGTGHPRARSNQR